jgi:hypothetical protein
VVLPEVPPVDVVPLHTVDAHALSVRVGRHKVNLRRRVVRGLRG